MQTKADFCRLRLFSQKYVLHYIVAKFGIKARMATTMCNTSGLQRTGGIWLNIKFMNRMTLKFYFLFIISTFCIPLQQNNDQIYFSFMQNIYSFLAKLQVILSHLTIYFCTQLVTQRICASRIQSMLTHHIYI